VCVFMFVHLLCGVYVCAWIRVHVCGGVCDIMTTSICLVSVSVDFVLISFNR